MIIHYDEKAAGFKINQVERQVERLNAILNIWPATLGAPISVQEIQKLSENAEYRAKLAKTQYSLEKAGLLGTFSVEQMAKNCILDEAEQRFTRAINGVSIFAETAKLIQIVAGKAQPVKGYREIIQDAHTTKAKSKTVEEVAQALEAMQKVLKKAKVRVINPQPFLGEFIGLGKAEDGTLELRYEAKRLNVFS